MLSAVFSPGPASPPSPALLLGDGLQNGEQSGQPSTLALHARERRLLPRPGERRPGPGVAVAPSWVLAQSSTCRHCVTRSLNGRTHWFYYQNGQFGALSVTRDLNRATSCSDWLNCPYRWNTVAPHHRPHPTPFPPTRPPHSRSTPTRATKLRVYLQPHFAPRECAQVDWGVYGTVAVGNPSRRLSFFVMVLAFSRQMFVEFTVSQPMEHFLACHEHGFSAFGGVPSKIMVDNLKSAVLQPLRPAPPPLTPRALVFAPAPRPAT